MSNSYVSEFLYAQFYNLTFIKILVNFLNIGFSKTN